MGLKNGQNPGSYLYKLAFSLWVLSLDVRTLAIAWEQGFLSQEGLHEWEHKKGDKNLKRRQTKTGPVKQSTWVEDGLQSSHDQL